MLKEVLTIILIDSLPIIGVFLVFRKLFKLTKIPILLLIILSMLIVSLNEIYSVQKKINNSHFNCDYFFK